MWRLRLASGRDHLMLRAVLTVTHEEVHVTFSAEGLQRLKLGLEHAGVDAKFMKGGHSGWRAIGGPVKLHA